ncbi:MAG: ATP-binding protein [Bryobacteraceae bacterium]|nr:ATP-binding protein [Bryobacteraceae bacterium]
MNSLFAKILLWFLAATLITAAAVIMTAAVTFSGMQPRQAPFALLVTLQMQEAREAWESGGRPALEHRLQMFNQVLNAQSVLTDAEGRDLVTAEDRSEDIRAALDRPRLPYFRRDNLVLARQSDDGRYWFLSEMPRRRFLGWILHPQFLWIPAVMLLLCYLLARHLTGPVLALQTAVDRFGQGDLSARVSSKRKDEIGHLARTFDRMADRIQTLLSAERRLLADISHELRSPLARLGVAVELARTAEDREASLDRIEKESARLNALVGELLQVTRAEGDPAARRFSEVRLHDLVAEIVLDGSLEARARGVQVLLREQRQVTLRGDSELLRRAIENVVRNGIRYAPGGTVVEVFVEGPARVRVRDHGPGVPEEELTRIFDPFYRVEADRNRQAGGGAGLGLSIAKRAVELHHGTIAARNAGPGLEVTIELPLP